jgi:peroxiredoxin
MAAGTIVQQIEETVARCREMDGSLNERLTVVANAVRSLNPKFADAIEELIARLRQGGAGTEAPQLGEPMPAFLLPDENGTLIGLDDLIRTGPVAMVFNRGHWCPYCRLNTVALSEVHKEAGRSGARIVAITPETQAYTRRLKTWANAPFPILTDMDNGYALSLGLAVWVGSEVERYNKIAGVNLPSYQGNESWTIPIPATFIVGADGLIKGRYVDPDYRQRMAMDELVQGLKAASN